MTGPMLSRRALLAGLAAGTAIVASGRLGARAASGMPDIVARYRLSEQSGFVLANAVTGEIIEAHAPEIARPPASVAKVLTALYGLETLGAGFRFSTRLIATGPVVDGRINGDLILDGAGDPGLDTDALGGLAAALAARGIGGIDGKLMVTAGALPELGEIEAGQPAQAAYNPGIAGMGLNFNRVHLRWEQGAQGLQTKFVAPGIRYAARVPGFAAAAGDGTTFSHGIRDGIETWTLPRRALRGEGGVWLPVRRPAAYAGSAFRQLAADAGVDLPDPVLIGAAPEGEVLAGHDSAALTDVTRDMLRYSTNLTAEVIGLRASGAPGLARSGLAMSDWARRRYGIEADLVNHSGLSDRSVIAPEAMLAVLLAERARMPQLLRPVPVADAGGRPMDVAQLRVRAKSGTMHFIRGLAGYIERDGGALLAFAILAADPEGRARMTPENRDDPPGSDAWLGRAREQERALLRHWAALHAPAAPPRPRPRPAAEVAAGPPT